MNPHEREVLVNGSIAGEIKAKKSLKLVSNPTTVLAVTTSCFATRCYCSISLHMKMWRSEAAKENTTPNVKV